MNKSRMTPSEAAEAVLREHERQRDETRKKRGGSGSAAVVAKAPELEQVTSPKWDGLEGGEVDASELDQRQRALSETLERRQRQVHQQGKKLAAVRAELVALERPLKADIMGLREKLETANRAEMTLVQSVNMLRKELFEKEKLLAETRTDKQTFVDDLIRVMADYERRKTERLNEIADLVGVDSSPNRVTNKPSNFTGF